MVRLLISGTVLAASLSTGCGGGGGGGGDEPTPTPTSTPGPTVVERFPEADASDVARNTTITATFDQDLDPSTIVSPAAGFTAEVGGNPITGTVSYDAPTRTATLTPGAELAASANVEVHVATTVTNTAGIPVASEILWAFTTGAIADTTPPTFAGLTGASDGANGSAVLTWAAATDDIAPVSQIRYRAYLSTNLASPIITVIGGTSLQTPPFPAGTYSFVVRAADPAGNLEMNAVEQSTAITVPPAAFADVQAVFTQRCVSAQCHDASNPAGSMNLTAGAAYGDIVNVDSSQNGMLKRVKPFDATSSYLYRKVLGSGISGNRMPPSSSLPSGERDLIRNWILNGAPP